MKNSIEVFYEHLKKKAGSDKRLIESIGNWTRSEIVDFIIECKQLLPKEDKKSNSIFNFVANSSLSGGKYPCLAVECRFSRVDTLARFASLYSDSVLIQDPFPSLHDDFINNAPEDDLRYELMTALGILQYLQPLVKKGIVGFATSEFHFCPDCYQRYIKDLEFEKNKSNISSFLEEKILRNVDFKATIQDDQPTIEITGPEDLVSHGSSLLMLYEHADNELRNTVMKKATSKRSSHFSKKEIARWGLLQELTGPVMSDLTIQNYYAELYGTQPVTDTEIDFELMSTINQSKRNILSSALANGLAHSVPYLADIEISKLLKLRENEGESFNVYRDAFSQAIQSVEEPNAVKIRQLFNDSVRPELNNIELSIKNSRKLLWGSLAKDLVFGAGFVTVGLFSGLLPSNIGEIVAALGGFNFVSNSLGKISELAQEPLEIRNNKYYFLWKAKKQS